MAFVSLPAGLPSRSIGVRRGGACPLHAADRRRAAQWASGVSSNRAVRSPCLSRLLPAVTDSAWCRHCFLPMEGHLSRLLSRCVGRYTAVYRVCCALYYDLILTFPALVLSLSLVCTCPSSSSDSGAGDSRRPHPKECRRAGRAEHCPLQQFPLLGRGAGRPRAAGFHPVCRVAVHGIAAGADECASGCLAVQAGRARYAPTCSDTG